MNVEALRKKHPKFFYRNFSYRLRGKSLEIIFEFFLEPNIVFSPKVIIANVDRRRFAELPKSVIDNLVFHLGLAEIPSYWKCACSPEIVIEAGHIDGAQRTWWKALMRKGLAEFFYRNGIDNSDDLFSIISKSNQRRGTTHKAPLASRYLVPLGGGKDSVVSMELLKTARQPWRAMILGNVKAATEVNRIASKQSPIYIKRTIDPTLIELNKKGYLNGHVPFSSYLAFLSVFVAVLFDYKYIAVSNERSANEGNIQSGKQIVNHQYSKSFDFEKRFREYAKKHLSTYAEFFSLLRPLYELQIAKLFSAHKNYFRTFRSCNIGMKENVWCGRCAKCFAIYTLLAPFLSEKELVKIFGKNLFEDTALWHFIPEFLGQSGPRPFDCIGTEKETAAALCLALEKYTKNNEKIPKLLKKFERAGKMPRNPSSILAAWNDHNFVPKKFAKIIKRRIAGLK